MSFDTGNNAPKQRGVLTKIAKEACRYYRCSIMGVIADAGGRYAYRMQDINQNSFILIAKGSRIWVPREIGKQVLSIQRTLLSTASLLNIPIILGFKPNPTSFVTWYRLDPGRILEEGWAVNARSPSEEKRSSTMLNFAFELAVEVERPGGGLI